MRIDDFSKGYDYFDQFISDFLLNERSLLTEKEDLKLEIGLNECYRRYILNPIEGKPSFDEKISQQFSGADSNTLLTFAHAMWLWSFSVRDIKPETKKSYTQKLLSQISEHPFLLTEVYPRGFGSGGERHTRNKFDEVKFALLIIKYLFEKIDEGTLTNVHQVKKRIEELCIYKKYGKEFEGMDLSNPFFSDYSKETLAMPNILLYLANPDGYEPIASNKDKNLICSSFSSLLTDKERKLNQDDQLGKIREVISEYYQDGFSFYDWTLKKVWDYSSIENEFDEIHGLEYKKAIILYGPPGTSKTYSARQIAETLITKHFLSDKENIRSFFEGLTDKSAKREYLNSRIHYLQFHPSYTYVDFVAGVQLKENETKAVKGKIFQYSEKARKDKYPHVLILDEINRVDVSQVFGEVFSALENRDKETEVGVDDFKLNIPKNLYVIGTMNEIDFSLERIDFALRRRFLWHKYGFNAGTLRSIIHAKQDEYQVNLGESEIERFIENAERLNKEITENIPELGEQYEIGHTFFAEIVDIYKGYLELNGYTSQIKNKIFRKEGPAHILWDISIEPILRALLGSVNPGFMNDKMKELRNIFIA